MLNLFLLLASLKQYPAFSSAVKEISSFSCHFRPCLILMHRFVAKCRSHLCNGFGCVMRFVPDTLEPCVPSVILISCNREEISDI